ncbi:hypothetical protein [Neobacillus niacini]|nr:hypothetical protein [Neobacillus niacini]
METFSPVGVRHPLVEAGLPPVGDSLSLVASTYTPVASVITPVYNCLNR